MARLVSAGLIFAISAFSGAAVAADPSAPSPSARDNTIPARNFSVSNMANSSRPDFGARIIAGREVMRNGTIGIGFFGHKPASPQLAPVTARDLSVPKQRKAAVGFSLRF